MDNKMARELLENATPPTMTTFSLRMPTVQKDEFFKLVPKQEVRDDVICQLIQNWLNAMHPAAN